MCVPTCIIGARYKDGVIVASDRRVTIGEYKITEEQKMFLVHKNQLAVAFAGLPGVADDFRRSLERDQGFLRAKTMDAALEPMNDLMAKIRAKYIKRRTFSPDEQILETIVCGLDCLVSGKPELYRLDQKGFSDIIPESSTESYITSGSSRDYADSMLKLCYDKSMNKGELTEVLSYVILQCALLDPQVGGKPSIVIVEQNRQPSMLSENDVDKVVRKAEATRSTVAKILRRLFGEQEKIPRLLEEIFEKEEKYRLLEEYFIDEATGIVRSKRSTNIILEYYTDLGPKLIKGHVVSNYVANNTSPMERALFIIEGKEGLITKGVVTIPQRLKKNQIPHDPTGIWDLDTETGGCKTGVRINNEEKTPQKIVKWANRKDHSKGVDYELLLNERIEPQGTRKVFWATQGIYDMQDYIVRRFNNYGFDAQISIKKPDSLDVAVIPFLQVAGEKPSNVNAHKPVVTPTSYDQEIVGTIVPGNGFVIMWWPKQNEDARLS